MGQQDHFEPATGSEHASFSRENDAKSSPLNTTATTTIFSTNDPVLFTNEHPVVFSPGISECWLGAEVQVENISSRRCSYEEMVHENENDLGRESNPGPPDSEDVWYQAVLRITQWAITLQEIKDEPKTTGLPGISNKCLCHKASGIGQKLNHLTKVMLNIVEKKNNEDTNEEICDDDEPDYDLMQLVNDVQSALRAGVSIQVRYFQLF